ncbi:hypothetical protein Q1695_004752 [Nippostrongylus brasiliensis]|nr:hypothetical protein Q1695_004752 [Nippostrongylus brasiliensis]
MSSRKKVQKKRGRVKEVPDDFDDLVENANDDGCGLTKKHAADLVRLVKCHSKPLNKVATEFIEIFKERCSLIVGMALLAIYDDLAATDDITSKIVAVYLIYRVRDIEVALRRRSSGGVEDILGHPFMSFFLNLVSSPVVDDICVSYPLPSGVERSIVLRILSGKVSEFVNQSANDLVAQLPLNDANLGFTEVEQFYEQQSARWPEHLDMVTIPAILPYPDEEDTGSNDLSQDSLLASLMERISCEPVKQLPFKATPLVPPLYPFQPIELGCSDVEELQSRMGDVKSSAAGASNEKDFHRNESSPTTQVQPAPQELSNFQVAEFTRRLMDGKSLTQSETKLMLKALEYPEVKNDLREQFSRMTDLELSRLIDLNVKIAIEIVDLCVTADVSLASRIMRVVQGMDVTVQCMEVVTRLYQFRNFLPREPLNDYVRYCIRCCLEAPPSSNLNRVVRLVAITLKNLLKGNCISAQELSLELREFGVKFCQHPDTTFLFQTVGPQEKAYLYEQPACALFIFRMLPPVTQQIVIKMIWNANVSASMTQQSSKTEVESAEKLLKRLGIMTSTDKLHPVFRRSYLRSIMIGAQKCAKINSAEVEPKRRQNEKELGKKAAERWECILRYLALPSDKNMSSVSATTLSAPQSDASTLDIQCHTDASMFTEYLKLEASKDRDIRPILDLLIRVILCVVRGGDFSQTAFEINSNWTEEQTTLIMHMRELGLIFIRKRKDG